MRSDRSMTDCRPVSIFSVQTVQQLSQELGNTLDKRRFRANVYVDLQSASGFGEQRLVGRSLRIGPKAVISILDRDPRCKMITLDPDTGVSDPKILRQVAQAHDATAGVMNVAFELHSNLWELMLLQLVSLKLAPWLASWRFCSQLVEQVATLSLYSLSMIALGFHCILGAGRQVIEQRLAGRFCHLGIRPGVGWRAAAFPNRPRSSVGGFSCRSTLHDRRPRFG
jgi:hypothetical protein